MVGVILVSEPVWCSYVVLFYNLREMFLRFFRRVETGGPSASALAFALQLDGWFSLCARIVSPPRTLALWPLELAGQERVMMLPLRTARNLLQKEGHSVCVLRADVFSVSFLH